MIISAKEALQLDKAVPTDEDKQQARRVLVELDEYIRSKMSFAGVPPIDIPVQKLSTDSAAKLVCIALDKAGWYAARQILSMPSRVQGSPPAPHHWAFHIIPKDSEYAPIDLSPSLVGLS